MFAAATRGLFDFSDVRLFDPLWWRLLNSKIAQAESQIRLESSDLRLRYRLTSLGLLPSCRDDILRQEITDRAVEAYTSHLKLLQPWIDLEQNEKETEDRLMKSWIEQYGDPNDPEVQARTREIVQKMNESQRKAREAAREKQKPLTAEELESHRQVQSQKAKLNFRTSRPRAR